jgi:predicted dehydrogenase
MHFWKGMTLLKEMIESGSLGNVLHVGARVGTYVTLVNSVSRYQARQPGSLFFDYSHQPDLFFWLTGLAPKSVSVVAFERGDLEFSSDPNVADIICEYDAALITHLHLNYVQAPQRHEYEVVGDEAWALVDFDHGGIRIGRRRERTIETRTLTHERDDIFRLEHEAFFDAADGKREPETSARDGMVSTAVCEASMRSYRSGRKVGLQI